MKAKDKLLGAFLLVLMCGSFPVWSVQAQSSSTQTPRNAENRAAAGASRQQPEEFMITATNFKFSPSEITVRPGARVKITLVNKAHDAHNIQFDLPQNHAMKLPKNIGFNETGSMEFDAPGPGTYSFKCPVDLHGVFGMKGKLIVKG